MQQYCLYIEKNVCTLFRYLFKCMCSKCFTRWLIMFVSVHFIETYYIKCGVILNLLHVLSKIKSLHCIFIPPANKFLREWTGVDLHLVCWLVGWLVWVIKMGGANYSHKFDGLQGNSLCLISIRCRWIGHSYSLQLRALDQGIRLTRA